MNSHYAVTYIYCEADNIGLTQFDFIREDEVINCWFYGHTEKHINTYTVLLLLIILATLQIRFILTKSPLMSDACWQCPLPDREGET